MIHLRGQKKEQSDFERKTAAGCRCLQKHDSSIRRNDRNYIFFALKKSELVFRTLLLLADVRCRLVKVQLKAEINQSLFILIFVLELNF